MTLYEFIMEFFFLYSEPLDSEPFYNLYETIIIFPELFFTICIFFLLMFCVLLSTSRNKNYPLILFSALHLSILICIFTFFLINNNKINFTTTFFNNTLIIDNLSIVSKELILIFFICCLLIIKNYLIKQQINTFEYLILMLFSVLGLIILCSANDLITAYLSIEIHSLAFYLLAAYKKNSIFSTKAGLKYFILGAFSSCMFLFGSSLIYGFSGTTNFDDLKDLFLFSYPTNTTFNIDLVFFGLIFILISLFFKLAIAPFHIWSPDVYEDSLSSSTLIFTILPKISLFILFIRIFNSSFLTFIDYTRLYLVLAGLFSIIIGAFVGLEQRKIKSLLAYSSISHMGYLILVLSTGIVTNLHIIFSYLIVYIISNLFIWTIVLNLNFKTSYPKKTNKDLSDFNSLVISNPLIALILSLTIFSLAGLPPLIGFYVKMSVFLTLIENTQYLSAIIAIICSVISAFYYIRLIKIIYFEKKITSHLYFPLSYEMSLFISIGFFFLIGLFLTPNIFYLFCYQFLL
uniref:NADH dehydrogenase subunit 2 n=1 Tax=Melosira undulata TaxID=2133757 RepID=A0A3G1PWD7_9STRA|nr:NADH dehydrogenase subunit 2 [Melosira undulata]AVR57555.1 NADH dehydrogenase subunit 2 [Melosira undulata]